MSTTKPFFPARVWLTLGAGNGIQIDSLALFGLDANAVNFNQQLLDELWKKISRCPTLHISRETFKGPSANQIGSLRESLTRGMIPSW